MKKLLLLILFALPVIGFGQTNIIPTACASNSFTVTTGDHFYDDGGPGGCLASDGCVNNYANASCTTQVVLCPSVPGNMLTLQFQTFAMWNTTSVWDWIEIYDSNNFTGTMLFDNGPGGPNVPYGDNGTDPMFSVSSTNPSGCLSIRFYATSVVNRAGWDALILEGPIVLSGASWNLDVTDENMSKKLSWNAPSTASELRFSVERSEDGENFVPLTGLIDQMEVLGGDFAYSFVDGNPIPGKSFYRVKYEEENGNSVFSNAVESWSDRPEAVVLGSNPVQNDLVVNLYSNEAGTARGKLMNLSGSTLRDWEMNLQPGRNVMKQDFRDLPAGMYLLQVSGPFGTSHQRILLSH